MTLTDDQGVIAWPWQLKWIQQILWESLNFAILATVCIICRPTENSRLLSYAQQLPTEDPDDDLDDEIHNAISTYEMVPNFVIPFLLVVHSITDSCLDVTGK